MHWSRDSSGGGPRSRAAGEGEAGEGSEGLRTIDGRGEGEAGLGGRARNTGSGWGTTGTGGTAGRRVARRLAAEEGGGGATVKIGLVRVRMVAASQGGTPANGYHGASISADALVSAYLCRKYPPW